MSLGLTSEKLLVNPPVAFKKSVTALSSIEPRTTQRDISLCVTGMSGPKLLDPILRSGTARPFECAICTKGNTDDAGGTSSKT